jgi:hypothetical protein
MVASQEFTEHIFIPSLCAPRLRRPQASSGCIMTSLILQYSAASLLFCATALAVTPIVASTTSYGSLVNAGLNRDSCTSSFWTNNVVVSARHTPRGGTHFESLAVVGVP